MRVLLTLAILGAAAIEPPAAEPQGNRYLFVVDISSGMRRLDAANRQALFDLVYTGVGNQMIIGDTFGVWTFNTKLAAGEFAMHTWHPTNALESASHAATFLKKKRYSDECDFTPLFFSVDGLVKSVKDVNVFILTDGATPMKGTAADAGINAAFRDRAAERKKAGKPFIVALAARGGALTNWSVTLPGETIPLPPPPPRLVAKPPVQPVTNAPAVAMPVITRPPLILKGTPAPPKPIVEPPAVTASTETVPPIVATPTPAATVKPELSVRKSTDEPPTSTPAGESAAVVSLAPSLLGNAPAPATPAPPAMKVDSTVAPAADTPEPAPARVAEQNNAAPSLLAAALANAPSLRSESRTADSFTPAASFTFNPQWLMLAGCALLLGVFGLLVMIYRRMHRLPSPSIITRSMERR